MGILNYSSQVALLCCLVLFNSCAPFPKIAMPEYESEHKLVTESGEVQTYESNKASAKSAVIFTHGSPGKGQHWLRYLSDDELGDRFRLIAYDRPGYGKSTRGFYGLDAQVRALHGILERQEGSVTLVGHSLGGAVVLAAAARYPEKVSRVIALAPSSDPKPSKVYRLNQVLRYTGLGFVLPGSLGVSHREVLALFPSLRELEGELGGISCEVVVVQGRKDQLVPATNIPFLKSRLKLAKPRIIDLRNEGHFLPWKQYELVKSLLLDEV